MQNNNSLDPSVFLADFHRARAHALRNAQTVSAARWKHYLDALNHQTAKTLFRRNSLMLYIALAASAFCSLFVR